MTLDPGVSLVDHRPPSTLEHGHPLKFVIDTTPAGAGVDSWWIGGEMVERDWLPIIGPSCFVMARKFLRIAADHGLEAMHVVDAATLFASIGLDRRLGRHAAGPKTLLRLERYGFVRFDEAEGAFIVRKYISAPASRLRLFDVA